MIAVPPSTAMPSFVSKTLDDHLNEPPRQCLHHYCSSQALMGIAKEKELWATDLGFMNDEAEREHGIGLISDKIDRLHETATDADKVLFGDLKRQVTRGGESSRVYAASFTEEVTLSMFRMYCPDGGYCLRVPSEQLLAMCKYQDFRLAKCIYNDETKQKIIDELLNGIIDKCRAYQRAQDGLASGIPRPPGPRYYSRSDVRSFGAQAARWASIMKDKSFEIENEWRIVSKTFDAPPPDIDFRDGRFNVTPYYKFKLSRLKDGAGLIRNNEPDSALFAWVGPANSNQERRKVAAKWLFRRYFNETQIGSVGVKIFPTTFR